MQHGCVDRPDLELDPARVLERLGKRNFVQRRRGLPMSTAKLVAPTRAHGEQTGTGLEEQTVLVGRARHDRIAHHRPGDAARAVAAGGGLRAVGVVDAQVGVGAGRHRIVDRHQLVEARPRLGRGRPRFSAEGRESEPRRSTITISLPRPFIFRKRRFASALTAGSDVVLEEGVDFAAIWAESTAFASCVASRLGNRPMVETPGPEPDSRLSR